MDKELQIYEVNLAVSNCCNANCIFCPRSFEDHKNKFMSVDTVERIMAEVIKPEFRAAHPVVHSVLSENGEPFLNPNILDLLRIVRRAGLSISMFSNFSLITKEIAEVLIQERLTDNINFNIDGLMEETYYAVKGIGLAKVEENIKRFVRMRDEVKAPIHLFGHVISHYTYTNAVMLAFGKPPVKWNGLMFPQDGPETVKKWQGILNPELDNIGEDGVMFWAERYNEHYRPGNFPCSNIGRVKHVAYINPDGNWYACCFDMGNDLVVGNVLDTSILEVSISDKRKDLISKLEGGRFSEIGFPCVRVDSCSAINRGEIK